MTMDNTKGYHSRLRIAQNADTALSITPSIGGGGEVGCSYLLKRHHFFSFQIKYSYQKYNTSTISGPYKIPYSSKFEYHTNNFFDSYISIQIPLIYGYSILNKANFFFFTPYVGWVNQFNFLKGQYNHYFSFTEPLKKVYFGYILAGFRIKVKWFYLDCSYARMLTKYREPYSTVRLQTVNLSLGYVYTFKTKAERQKTKK